MARWMFKRIDYSRRLRLLFISIGFTALAMSTQLVLSEKARADSASVEATDASGDYGWMLGVLNENRIGGRFGQGANGNITVNTAAGSANLQANLRALQGTIEAGQQIDNPRQATSVAMEANSRIDGRAFSRGSGALGVNQVAGDSNAQINSMALAPTGEGFKEIRALEPVNPVQASDSAARDDGQSGEVPSGRYRAVVTDTAFSGFGGVLQINQVSGSRNVTANHFSMSGQRP